MEQKKTRMQWIEIARVIAILSVILQHVPKACPFNAPVLTSSLALFFILSGYFSASKLAGPVASAFVRKRMWGLFKPYILWNVFFGLAAIAYFSILGEPSPIFRDKSLSGMAGYWLGIGSSPALIPLWFIRDLIVFNFLVFLLMRFGRVGKILLCAVGFMCLFLLSPFPGNNWPNFHMFGNFCLGVLFSFIPNLPQKWKDLPIGFHASIVAAFLFLSAMLCTSLKSVVYEPITPLGVAAIMSAGIILERMALGKRLAGWGEATFFIFCFHTIVICILMGLEIVTFDWPPFLWWATVPVVYLTSLACYFGLKRCSPKLFGYLDVR